ncbi:Alpha Beta hydrolase [Pyrenophora seminiperda CCB06]|uniref:Alpha Beta hydrolase n=1 Tax=Pyrenophora seminiperda CCB06 TaxID=1302712 RepID=A0A3M7M5B7_9PLEO|nr:Alpha Beta hydrolase [Pyrenophora seminiperda CCB06]
MVLDERYTNLNIQLSVANGLLDAPTDGRIVVMFAPNGTDPLKDTDVTSSKNKIYVTFSGGSNDSTETGVFGWPDVRLSDIEPGTYSVQAFLTKYETVTRSDGSTVSVRFPCGDGAPNVNSFGSLVTPITNVLISGERDQKLHLVFNSTTPVDDFPGQEIGSCHQGNYADTQNLKYIKIRSKKLSAFWGRDMYVGANVVLPAGYNNKTRYPVIYHQNHWAGSTGAYNYGTNDAFTSAWDAGIIPATPHTPARPTPKLILVSFRHEAPYYDDSYAVNTANLGPYGDALNDELIPYLEEKFQIIRAPYARIQDGGSTGGWESIANVVYRPDLFGACFSSYPDSLDFHNHQAIELYDSLNAYTRADGSQIPSIRTFIEGKEVVKATVAQENHWELSFGTATRSSAQWDVWNAVFGIQGYNNYPLEPWDKVTGEIYPEAVASWKPFDLADYIASNFHDGTTRKLGAALAGRIHIYVGAWDDYYLNLGVLQFQNRTDAAAGAPGWANITILPQKHHGGNYQDRETWDYLELVEKWVKQHAPAGPNPLIPSATAPSTRGNIWEEVIERGGRGAAVARQADPEMKTGEQKGWLERVWDGGILVLGLRRSGF